ncbi:hypothetical protein D9611_009389 [Ephemerocybe angulata]|uniref:BTB domain-containing protein n=1 Tax=Ephemerocybe angulata TaxID=980116 RepID=A0A8H5F490_9AGAR|nr:hypothetical protein D9611_009389 [Tulosesus angulatus]
MEPSQERLEKRRREDSGPIDGSEAEHSAPITRSTTVWYKDGNIVIQAGRVQFRFYKGILARSSTPFSDLFELPQPAGEPEVEDCPVLVIHDQPEDIEVMLQSLVDDSYDTRFPVSYKTVCSTIRMAHKYDMPTLRSKAIARLTMEFPDTLEGWDARAKGGGYARIGDVETTDALFALISLAHRYEIRRILPAAYYKCCSKMPELLKAAEPTVDIEKRVPFSALESCFKGRDILLESHVEANYSILEGLARPQGNVPDCMSRSDSCYTSWRNHGHEEGLWKSGREVKGLDMWEQWPLVLHLCETCRHYTEECLTHSRERTWENLPQYFDLGTWDDLKNRNY